MLYLLLFRNINFEWMSILFSGRITWGTKTKPKIIVANTKSKMVTWNIKSKNLAVVDPNFPWKEKELHLSSTIPTTFHKCWWEKFFLFSFFAYYCAEKYPSKLFGKIKKFGHKYLNHPYMFIPKIQINSLHCRFIRWFSFFHEFEISIIGTTILSLFLIIL